MVEIWKETLLPGTQVEARSGRAFTLTKRDIRAGERNINRMVAKGRRIPLIWEHLDVEENHPEEWKARYARNTFGWVGGARLSTADDVAAGIASMPGTLLVRHDVHDENDLKQLRRTGYVSPKIYHGYLDSQGERYEGLAVAHVAASPTVCQFWQAPFPKELSDSDAFYLSYTPPEENFPDSENRDSEKSCPDFTGSWDEWFHGLDAGDDDPQADDTPEPEPPVELSTTATPGSSTVADEPKKDDAPKGGGDGKNADLKAVMDAIKKAFPGATISDKVSSWSELVIALESNGGGEPDNDEPEPPADDAPPATSEAGSPPMLMSTLDKNPRLKALAEKKAKPEREDAAREIRELFAAGKIDGPTQRKLLSQAECYEMSFTDDYEPTGKRWKQLLADIEAAKKQAPRFKAKADGSPLNLSTTEVPPPAPASGLKDPTGQLGADILAGKLTVQEAASK